MPEGRVGNAPGDIRHHGERRVHDDDARHGGRIEMVVDLGGVEARDGHRRKERREKIGAGLGQLVEDERCARGLGEDAEQSGAGGRLQHAVGRGQCCRRQRGKAERDRRRELLKSLRLLGSARVRRQQCDDLGERRQP